MTNTYIAMITALLLLLDSNVAATTSDEMEPVAGAGRAVVTEDAKLLRVAKGFPGFGGMFFDENGDLSVYVLEDPRKNYLAWCDQGGY